MYVDIDEILAGFFVAVIVIALVIGVIMCANWTSEISCNAKATALGYQCEYGFWKGCVLIKEDGKRILLEQLREYKEE